MKNFLLLAAIIATTTSAHAQSGKSITYGAKAGLNASNIKSKSTNQSQTTDMKLAYHIGGILNIPVSEMFSVNPELVLSAEGGKHKLSGGKLVSNFTYINVPVMLQYNNPSGFFAETGPQLGLLIAAKSKVVYNGQKYIQDITDGFESINISWGLGLGYKLTAGLGFGTRYNFGISNIAENVSGDGKASASTLQIGLTYSFRK